MILNCLLCENGSSPDINGQCCHCYGLVRSANFSPPPFPNFRRNSSIESNRYKGHHKLANSTRAVSNKFSKQTLKPLATGEPRLVRSGGMRRDWSLEDLRNVQRNARKC
ncbi:hypothetical protein MA16_Dca019898 [Dendrobium catenatum]|uniref:Uncharacterized protein n=1 Tax=Dendrobium catenatum TaxID=906689 RepID=A0A2I0WXM1_9ASPA|nr:hypothetical protein MA16_Dca019898 [Dendrobium catenatum]